MDWVLIAAVSFMVFAQGAMTLAGLRAEQEPAQVNAVAVK